MSVVEVRKAASASKKGVPDRVMLFVFGAAICLGASLVFLVQPMVAKMILPILGGSPAVWSTSMVFFQAALLAGYAYAHFSTRKFGLKRQPKLHLAVLILPVIALPLALPAWAEDVSAPPALWVLALLAVAVGGPFFVAATASPLLQRWFSATGHPDAHDPYFLYAASNVGSLLALVGYPLAVEPNLSIPAQTWLWSGGYVLFALLVAGCALVLRRQTANISPEEGGEPGASETSETSGITSEPFVPLSWRTRLWWVLLAFIPSSLMLGVTTFLTTDVAPAPLLWVVPLGLYLLSFIFVFSRRIVLSSFLARAAGWALPALAVGLSLLFFEAIDPPLWATFLLHLAMLFSAAMVAHGRLASERPPPSRLTEFFLLVSVGGVLGGIFNALAAPQIFDSLLEYPIAIVLLLLVMPAIRRPHLPGKLRWAEDAILAAALLGLVGYILPAQLWDGWSVIAILILILSLTVAYLASSRPAALALPVAVMMGFAFLNTGYALYTERTFFGVYEVYTDEYERNVLVHGTTRHGSQSTDPETAMEPLAYYHRESPIGQVFENYDGARKPENVAVVGLGAGALAAYGEEGQNFTFYEIDPEVAEIAGNADLFTYLSNSRANVEVETGDGRLEMRNAPDNSYDLIILDAFSSDAISMHLMTREAAASYMDKLDEDGVIAFHITNRHLGLEPVIAGLAEELGLAGLSQYYYSDDYAAGTDASHWAILTRDEENFAPLEGDERWERLDQKDPIVWTDDFSDILGVFYWE